MHAVMLAAGIGRRLNGASGDLPKCLLEFAGSSLLERHLAILEHYRIPQLTLVVGHQADRIRQALAQIETDVSVTLEYNPDYRSGSVISFACAQAALCSGQPVLLMDADVLYDHRLLGSLLDAATGNHFLLDRDFEPGDEPVKLCVRDGQLVEFRKQIDKNLEFDFAGESVGFFRLAPDTACAMATTARQYLATGRQEEPYEEVIRDHLLATPAAFGYRDITGLAWIEIDFPEDIRRAGERIVPGLTDFTH